MEASRHERAVLPRELTEFLLELSVALHRHSMYPSGHPSLEPAVEAVVQAAERVLQNRTSIAIGVSRRQLLIDDVSTDADQPVLRRLAEILHRHHLGAVSVTRGVHAAEVADALRRLARDPDRDGALGFTTDGTTTWPHLKLHSLTFNSLALGEGGMATDASRPTPPRATDLWADLARTAMSLSSGEAGAEPPDPQAVARAINQHSDERAYDEAITRYLVEIARELTQASAANAAQLHEQTMNLIASLDADTLHRLVHMGGDAERRHQFVRDAAHGMAAGAVLEIVKAASAADEQTISHGLLRMLAKLANHAQRGTDPARPRADQEFRQQIGRLLENWTLENPNPQMYGHTLERLATSAGRSGERAEAPTAKRILQMSLESNTFLPLAQRALDDIVRSGQLNEVFELIASPPPESKPIADAMIARLTSPEAVTAMLAQDRVDLNGLDALLPRLAPESFGPLLDAMGSSPSRAIRRRLLDWLSQTNVDITPLVIERLHDHRWYVQRNMLVLLQRSGGVPAEFSAEEWTHHKDPRVRSEAIRLQLLLPHDRENGIRAALDDSDPRVVRLGLSAIPNECPSDVIDRVIDWAVDHQASDELRVLAVSTLGRFRGQSALNALLHLADGGRSLFGRPRLPLKTPTLLAALRALTDTWPDHPQAARIRAVAAKSSDPDIRETAVGDA